MDDNQLSRQSGGGKAGGPVSSGVGDPAGIFFFF